MDMNYLNKIGVCHQLDIREKEEEISEKERDRAGKEERIHISSFFVHVITLSMQQKILLKKKKIVT